MGKTTTPTPKKRCNFKDCVTKFCSNYWLFGIAVVLLGADTVFHISSMVVITDTTIVLAFMGGLATFVVIGNYIQVQNIKNEFEAKVVEMKKEFEKQVVEMKKEVEEKIKELKKQGDRLEKDIKENKDEYEKNVRIIKRERKDFLKFSPRMNDLLVIIEKYNDKEPISNNFDVFKEIRDKIKNDDIYINAKILIWMSELNLYFLPDEKINHGFIREFVLYYLSREKLSQPYIYDAYNSAVDIYTYFADTLLKINKDEEAQLYLKEMQAIKEKAKSENDVSMIEKVKGRFKDLREWNKNKKDIIDEYDTE